ncbi:MAG: ATP-binding cassette domain-containing protein [Crocinitomicaceae bacterium]|nr:ATP-binding cassette domain-containing protein [Crocinitomicaceae bacterium]
MSERILRALMQLFAIIAKIDEVSDSDSEEQKIQSTKGKEIITSFLKAELSSEDVNKYLNVFDKFLVSTRGKLVSKKKDQKRTSLHSVKILRICSQINKELTQRQKIIVLIRMFEFIDRDDVRTDKEIKFVRTVSDSFHIAEEEYHLLQKFIELKGSQIPDEPGHIYYSSRPLGPFEHAKSEVVEGLHSLIHVIYVSSVKTLFFRYFGEDELYINGQIVANDKTHVFNVGSTARTAKSNQLFYSDLISKITSTDNVAPISFVVKNVIHAFKGGDDAIRKMNLSTNAGKMIGIMGGSGTGKTSLLNIMNGKIKPTFGTVQINGIDLHSEKHKLEGVIGNVNQSDLLIEELTVFQNLYFSAKLSMKGYSTQQLTKKVISLLKSLGLYEIRFLKVGSALKKVISGGQRKRLNIALELIREPAILFVDEPTSGLSSRDSENIMDLLKELSLRGKLVFVIIHQPSSHIFKLFDRLVIMDQGGYPIYDGIPLNSIVHFKTFSYKGNAHERECNLCGNVNPEQIFNIIDAKIVDEFGNETSTRKLSPEDWNKIYKENSKASDTTLETDVPTAGIQLPNKLSQFFNYLKRDFLSKKSNAQYMLINGLVAPILALILSFFIKYFGWMNGIEQYSYYNNDNIPQYIFIAVIVSIFLGLTVAAEEINKDKKILAREAFINQSRSSYLMSKVAILFGISAVQSLLFVLIGNTILEINGMWLEYWMIMFSTACLSNLAGLNISSAFNSAKVIYIIIPLVIIPQLLFSGVIVKFDKLHPSLSDATKVPWIGNMMASRWAYEGLTVEQATQNEFESYFLQFDIDKTKAEWRKDYWFPEMRKQIDIIKDGILGDEDVSRAFRVLANEIEKEDIRLGDDLDCIDCVEQLQKRALSSDEDFAAIDRFIDVIRLQSIHTINKSRDSIQSIIDDLGIEVYKELQSVHSNDALNKVLTNRTESSKIIVSGDEIFQNDNPMFNDPKRTSFFDTHYYAPYKYIFGYRVNTYHANLIILWVITIITYVLLYFDVLKKFMGGMQRIYERVKPKKAPIR